MKLTQLEYFRAVAEERSISAAARTLHVAQPPISRQIALLEDELGVKLFRRGNKGMTLTEAGQSLYEQSARLFLGINEMVENVRGVGEGVRGRIRIGLLYSTVPFALRHIAAYHALYPEVSLHLRLGTPQELTEELDRGNLNVLFLRHTPESDMGLCERGVGEDALALIVTGALDPAPELPDVPLERLQDAPMCRLRSDDLWGYDEFLLSECRRQGVAPRIVCECYDTPMAMQIVRSGFGISFLPRSIVETHPGGGLYAKDVRGLDARVRAVMCWRDEAYLPACVRLFTQGT